MKESIVFDTRPPNGWTLHAYLRTHMERYINRLYEACRDGTRFVVDPLFASYMEVSVPDVIDVLVALEDQRSWRGKLEVVVRPYSIEHPDQELCWVRTTEGWGFIETTAGEVIGHMHLVNADWSVERWLRACEMDKAKT